MDTTAIDKIKQIFQEDEFDVGIIEEDEYAYIKTKNDENYLMTFHFENNSIFVNLHIFGVLGSVLLNKMEDAVETMPCNKCIRVTDSIYIEKFGHNDCITDFALIHILTTGQSWYNSLGYKSINYDCEIQHNKKKLEMPCEYFFRDVFGKSLKNYISEVKNQTKNKIHNIKNPEELSELQQKNSPEYIDEIRKQYRDEWNIIFEPINPETILRGKTVREFFVQLWKDTKDVSEKLPTLKKILDYVYKSKIIEYNNTLEKYIEQ